MWRHSRISTGVSLVLLMTTVLPTKPIGFSSGDLELSLAIPWIEKDVPFPILASDTDGDGISDASVFQLPLHEFAGFNWGSSHFTYYISVRISDDHSYLHVPWWPVAILGSLLLSRPTVFDSMRRRRVRMGRCPRCGYDLRSGHERCPECGASLGAL